MSHRDSFVADTSRAARPAGGLNAADVFVRRHAWPIAAVLVLALSSDGATAWASEAAHVGSRPAPVLERRDAHAQVLIVLAPGTPIQVFDREQDWCWVVVATDRSGGTTRSGWIRQAWLVSGASVPAPPAERRAHTELTVRLGPVTVGNQAPSSIEVNGPARRTSGPSAAGAPREFVETPGPSVAVGGGVGAEPRTAIRGGSSGTPPVPVGSQPERGSALGTWFQPRSLRGSVGFGYQSANVDQASGHLDERLLNGIGTVASSFAVLDPGILTVDLSGEFQLGRTTSRSSTNAFQDRTGLNSYRVEFGVLSVRAAPLRIYTDRVSSRSDLRSAGDSLDPLRRTQGVRTATGFTWDVNAPRLPRLQLSASTGEQRDERNYLFGYGSTSREQRAEIRATDDRGAGRFDVDFTHSSVAYDVPDAGMRSATGTDLLLASGRVMPGPRLSMDLRARASRFRLSAGSQGSTVTGLGGEGSVRYQLAKNLSASGRYAVSTNAFEAVLSGQLGAGQVGVTAVTGPSQLTTRTAFRDGEARVEYSTRPFTAAAILKTVSFGVPGDQPATLTALTTVGGLVHAERTVNGLTVSAGGDASVGRAQSNRSAVQPYRDGGIQFSVSGHAGKLMRFGTDGSLRRVARLDFFPVSLESRSVTARLEMTRPRWATVRVAVTQYDTLRDIVFSDSRDRHAGYTVGVDSPWYNLAVDMGQTDTNSLLLAPSVLGNRPDVAVLIASRPDLFGSLLAASDRSRVFSLQVRPFGGLTIQARVRRQDQRYPGLFGFQIRGEQVWATYQVRDVQLEVGLESFDSVTSFGRVRDRRLFVKVRRDLVFFR
ncbi:MAG TPA: hypothetical protein VGK32_02465 [Vicinamibacterales bacterium]|jgi:hypothetical protein